MENAGIPSATICTGRFALTAEGMAKMWGAPDYPAIFTERPRRRAEELAPRVVGVRAGDGN